MQEQINKLRSNKIIALAYNQIKELLKKGEMHFSQEILKDGRTIVLTLSDKSFINVFVSYDTIDDDIDVKKDISIVRYVMQYMNINEAVYTESSRTLKICMSNHGIIFNDTLETLDELDCDETINHIQQIFLDL